jgi:hypothetical protein
MGWMIEESGFDSRQVKRFSVSFYGVQTGCGFYRGSYAIGTRDRFPGVRRQVRQPGHSPLSSSENKDGLHGVVLN